LGVYEGEKKDKKEIVLYKKGCPKNPRKKRDSR